jgi:hypothetical protein
MTIIEKINHDLKIINKAIEKDTPKETETEPDYSSEDEGIEKEKLEPETN